jgi:hypothetical protein
MAESKAIITARAPCYARIVGSNHGPLWLGLILLLVGLMQAHTTWDRHREFLRAATLHSAKVTEVEKMKVPRGRGGGHRIEHWIHFEFAAPQGIKAGGKLPDDRKRYSVGDSVDVYWHPTTLECRYRAVKSLPLYGLALAALGLVFLGYWAAHARHLQHSDYGA